MRTAIPADAFEHGDHRRYTRGCRCRPCTTAISEHVRKLRYFRQTGRAASTTSQTAAQHIRQLRAAGMQDREIVAAAGIVPECLYRVLRTEGTIHRTTERRILAVTPNPGTVKGSGTHVPALGTVRRLRALGADGWTATELGRRAGKHKQFIVHLQNQVPLDGRVRMWVAIYVSELHNELRDANPESSGVASHRALQARKLAASKGWVPSPYWDPEDFDDPDFQPAAVDPQGRDQIAAVRRAEIEHLESFGLSEHEIARRLGMAPQYVRDLLREIRTGERRDRTSAAAA